MKSLRSHGGPQGLLPSSDFTRLCLLHSTVVLLVVDRFRCPVFLLIHLLAFCRREFSTIGRSFIVDFTVQVRLLVFEMRGFSGRQLPALDSLPNALLLIPLPCPNFPGIMLSGRIVLVLVDLLRQMILLLVQDFPVRVGELAIIESAHLMLFLVQPLLLPLQRTCFPSS